MSKIFLNSMESVKRGRFVRLIFDNSNPVIVGSGPSAAVIAEFLVSRGLMPTVFDAHTDTNIDESEAKELKELGFKPHLNSFDSYYQSNCSNIHYEKNFMARQSFKLGIHYYVIYWKRSNKSLDKIPKINHAFVKFPKTWLGIVEF